jgi:hypothetical protein
MLSQMVKNDIILCPHSVNASFKVLHKSEEAVEKFLKNFKRSGNLKKIREPSSETVSALQTAFIKDTRFKGTVPKIITAMAAVADNYGIPVEDIVSKFNIQNTRTFLRSGLSAMETTLLYASLSIQEAAAVAAAPGRAPGISKLLEKSITKKDEKYEKAAHWICAHLQTDPEFLKRVAKYADELTLKNEDSVDAVTTMIGNLKNEDEVARIEKRYKKTKFKFARDSICDMKFHESITGSYKAKILAADDTRAVMLGYETNCCQHLDGIGESSMMHGILNPKAGFWTLTNKNSDKLLAMAEVWEENEDTIVFDNIEFANDADISLYKEAIGEWLAGCGYANAKMGVGYNQMIGDGNFRRCGGVTPSVTPYEIYVISHEEESEAPIFKSEKEAREALERGDVTYFDYVYCDSERTAVFMKENGTLEPYFAPRRMQQPEEEIAEVVDDFTYDEMYPLGE